MRRILIIGNSGAGRSTTARHLSEHFGIAHLDLDSIAWEPGGVAVRRNSLATISMLLDFITANEEWVIEGVYGDLATACFDAATHLIFLNPPIEVCRERNSSRPHEIHKFDTHEAQKARYAELQPTYDEYYNRTDDQSYLAHRTLYDAFRGLKREFKEIA